MTPSYTFSRCLTGEAVESVPTVGVPPNVGLDVEIVGTSNVISMVVVKVGTGDGARVEMINSVGGVVGSADIGISVGDRLGSGVIGEGVGSDVVGETLGS